MGAERPERPSPPEFPLLEIFLYEDSYQTALRWQEQMKKFKQAWDEWAKDLTV